MKGLDALLANRSQLMVLRALSRQDGPVNGRAVERLTGLSNRATMVALDSLVNLGTVLREADGRAYQFLLNRRHYLVRKALTPAFEAEVFFWDDLRKTIRRTLRPRPIAAVATGPLAREETTYGGRLTLTLLFSTGRNRIRALASLPQLSEEVRIQYAMACEYHLLDLNTMDRNEYSPLWRRVETEGILLFGALP